MHSLYYEVREQFSSIVIDTLMYINRDNYQTYDCGCIANDDYQWYTDWNPEHFMNCDMRDDTYSCPKLAKIFIYDLTQKHK